jgi:hypothetical protein
VAGELWTEVATDRTPDEVWHTVLRVLAEVTNGTVSTAPGQSETQQVVITNAPRMPAGPDGPAALPLTIDHAQRTSMVTLDLKDVPPGLTGLLELRAAARGPGTVLRIAGSSDQWWAGAASRIASIGFVRKRVTAGWETNLHTIVREFLARAVDADDDSFRRLLEEGTPTANRLAAEREARLAAQPATRGRD